MALIFETSKGCTIFSLIEDLELLGLDWCMILKGNKRLSLLFIFILCVFFFMCVCPVFDIAYQIDSCFFFFLLLFLNLFSERPNQNSLEFSLGLKG